VQEYLQYEKLSETGLGMYVVKQIVDQHGGDLKVSSVVGKGTTIFIRLPVSGGPVYAA